MGTGQVLKDAQAWCLMQPQLVGQPAGQFARPGSVALRWMSFAWDTTVMNTLELYARAPGPVVTIPRAAVSGLAR